MAKNYDENYENSGDDLDIDDNEEIISSEESKEEVIEDDEVDGIEDGFMKGYEGGDKLAKCALCKKPLKQNFVEADINGDIHRFCTEDHADTYMRKMNEGEEE